MARFHYFNTTESSSHGEFVNLDSISRVTRSNDEISNLTVGVGNGVTTIQVLASFSDMAKILGADYEEEAPAPSSGDEVVVKTSPSSGDEVEVSSSSGTEVRRRKRKTSSPFA